MTNGPKLRPEMALLPTYKAGQSAKGDSGLTPYKLSSNENPFAPLPSVVTALHEAVAGIHRYPDPFCTRLTELLAQKFSVAPSAIATGTGSVGVCQQIVQAVAGAGDEVMFAWRSFEAYPIITMIAGATPVQVPLRDGIHHDLDAMLAAITSKTRLIFLCTPNNPTGAVLEQDAVEQFLAKVPSDVLVIIDEAYVEFNRDTTAVDGLALLPKFENVGVLRTFSKAYGLAGLRVGFFIGPENVAEAVRKTAVPFGVSNIAQVAAVTSLEHENELLERVADLVEERSWFESEVCKLGFALPDSQANFIWLPLGEQTTSFAELCFANELAVRPFAGEGLRISIGEHAGLERALTLLAQLGSEHPQS